VAPVNLSSFEVGAFDGIIDLEAADEGWGVREVRIKVDGAEQPVTDALPPYHFENADFPAGTWELVGVAEDWAGNIAESEPVYIGIGEVPMVPEAETTGVDESGSGDGTGPDAGTSSGGGEEESSGSTGELGLDEGGGGCGCRSGGSPATPWWLVGVAFVVRRRRRRQVP
jgi:MYXO-CTERM domain-containing protein